MVYGAEFRVASRSVAPTVLLALLLLTVLTALPAGVAAQEGPALVRLVHLAPGTPTVDVYVDGTKLVGAVPFKTASKYHRMPASTHALVIRPTGSASTSAASERISVLPGTAYTVALLGTPAQLQARVAKDDFSAPPPGSARLRIIDAAPQSPPLDIGIAGGPTLFRNVTFGMISEFVTVKAGMFSLEVREAGGSTVLFTQGASRLPAGTIITVAGTITPAGKIEMLPILDAAGAGNLPRGGVATGAGGTADAPAHRGVGAALVIGLLALIMVTAGGRLRRYRERSV
jgi:Domain of unknown function (DUF4397)